MQYANAGSTFLPAHGLVQGHATVIELIRGRYCANMVSKLRLKPPQGREVFPVPTDLNAIPMLPEHKVPALRIPAAPIPGGGGGAA